MGNLYFEIQGLTWKGEAPYQQDAMLINDNVIQHNGLITKCHYFDLNAEWCIAVADGVSHSPKAAQAAKTILGLTSNAFKNSSSVNFKSLQDQFSQRISAHLKALGSSTTLALISHTQDQFLTIQHLGNSRAYLYSFAQKLPKWVCLTRDHTHLEELRSQGKLKVGEQYASIYNMLTEYFCADPLHTVNNRNSLEEYLTENEAILICSDGVYDILECHAWPDLTPEITLKDWLTTIKAQLEKLHAYDNVSILIARLKNEK